jgi:hypothetical protein
MREKSKVEANLKERSQSKSCKRLADKRNPNMRLDVLFDENLNWSVGGMFCFGDYCPSKSLLTVVIMT